MKNNKSLGIILIIIIVLIAGGVSYYIGKGSNTSLMNKQINNYQPQIDNNVVSSDNEKIIQNNIVVIGKPFNLSVGETININKNDSIKFLKIIKNAPGSCGGDVQNCPDSVVLIFNDGATANSKEFSLYGTPYKIGIIDIVNTKKIDNDTYEFKVLPSEF